MLLIVNGLNITKYIAAGGFGWQRNDLDGPNAGRTLSGKMLRDRKAIKIKITISTIDLPNDVFGMIARAIEPEYVMITYDDPEFGRRENVKFYSNNTSASCLTVYDDGTEIWDGITFPLIEA